MGPSRWLYTVPLRLRSLVRPRRIEQELEEELQFHLERHMEEQIARVMPPEEARRSALRAMDGLARRKEECREMRRWNWLDHLVQDLRYAGRMVRRSPAFTVVAIASLALGIGSNTAIFSLVNAVLLRSLPVSHAEELVLVRPVDGGGFAGNLAYPDYQRLRDRNQIFSGLIASDHLERSDVGIAAAVEAADGEIVSGNYFAVLGVRPLLGRLFTQEDEDAPLVVIGYDFWRRNFAHRPAVGQTIMIDGAACTIGGVAPREFSGESAGYAADFWVPLGLQRRVYPNPDDLKKTRNVSWLDVMGRLRPGATLGQAEANLKVLVSQIHHELGIHAERDYLSPHRSGAGRPGPGIPAGEVFRSVACVDGRGGAGPAGGVHEPRQPADGAVGHAAAGDGDASGDGGEPRTAGAPTAYGEPWRLPRRAARWGWPWRFETRAFCWPWSIAMAGPLRSICAPTGTSLSLPHWRPCLPGSCSDWLRHGGRPGGRRPAACKWGRGSSVMKLDGDWAADW
jgi:hypothetical protein